ncbi:hypothetical protein FRC12_006137 [Ceratobasidium sp. 428]|nr:hypothetical protein FRC12_006137 [Ceratobasidium sp. 428]
MNAPYSGQARPWHYASADPVSIVYACVSALEMAYLLFDSVFGCTGVGKSTFVNDASRAELDVGHGLASQTKEIQTSPVFQVDGRNVQLYDTPGFDDTMLTDTQILTKFAEFLEGRYNTGKKINGLLYFHRITDNRMTGASVRSFDLFTKICGLPNMRNAMIVTNMWSDPADPEEMRRYEQLQANFFKSALDGGAKISQRGRIGPQSARAIIQAMVNLPPIELELQTQLARGLALDETEAGILVDQNLRVKLERQRQERKELEKELQEAREDRDRRAQEQLERYKRDREQEEQYLLEQIDLLQASRHRLRTSAQQPDLGAPTSPIQDTPSGHDRAGGRSGGLARIFRPNARLAGSRGRDPRSASLDNSRSLQAEHRTQERTRSATPTRRSRGFRFRSRIKMMYWRRSRSETRQ